MSLTLGNVTVDCGDAAALAAFYAALLEREVDPGGTEFFATIGGSPVLMFIKVPDPTPGKNRIHLDLRTTEIPEQVARAVALGAKHVADFAEYGAVWTTLTDPEGNVFDIGNGGSA
jgi:predicted enzyme related to lactoylglutathione lyase